MPPWLGARDRLLTLSRIVRWDATQLTGVSTCDWGTQVGNTTWMQATAVGSAWKPCQSTLELNTAMSGIYAMSVCCHGKVCRTIYQICLLFFPCCIWLQNLCLETYSNSRLNSQQPDQQPVELACSAPCALCALFRQRSTVCKVSSMVPGKEFPGFHPCCQGKGMELLD